MRNPLRICFVFAAFSAAMGVMLGALATHLPDRLFAVPGGRAMLHSAVEIQMWHAIALCALSLGAARLSTTLIQFACISMAVGTVLFCAPVTLLALFDLKAAGISIGRVAPYGGTLLMVSWCLVAAAAIAKRNTD